jgi:hypothetical protein
MALFAGESKEGAARRMKNMLSQEVIATGW